jgi:hypothetical protein
MIEDLTNEKLKEYGWNAESIERFNTWEKYDAFIVNGKQCYYATNIENKIYSGLDAYRLYYFRNGNNVTFPLDELNLIDEYYQLKRDTFLKELKSKSGKAFIEKAVKERFRQSEIEDTKNTIKALKEKPKGLKKYTDISINKYTAYLEWLNEYKNKPPQKEKNEHIVVGNDESTETLFEKIKDWEIISQVKVAVSFDNPKRAELFNKIMETATNEMVKQNITLVVQRIKQAEIQISGYTASEIEYYQSIFAKGFYTTLHLDDYQTYIEDKIRRLHFYCSGLEQDLRTKTYEFLEDREQDKEQYTESERYRIYLENLLIHLGITPKQQAETKTDKLKVKQIALIHVYEGIQITRDNAGNIAAEYGYTAKNSGEGLFQDYTTFCSIANRKGKPTLCTPKKLKNKIELFESVVNHLTDNNKQRAIDEINILKTIFENEY